MKASARRILSMLISMMFITASFLVLTYMIQPAYNNITDTRSQITSKTELRDSYKNSLDQVAKLKKDYQNILQSQQSISSILPEKEDIAQSVNQVVGLAKANSLKAEVLSLDRLAVRPSVQKNFARGIGTTRINFKISGAYENFRPFIEQIETNLNLMDVNNLKLDPVVSAKTGDYNFTYTLVIDNYYQAD
ncbi:MAG: type 4a pilus biogenesis protein PilO [Candidatus Wolfebacteria bacterium]|nr:type 4a pilus biogenesis protein PilO [Candidatus Wolfebacteria bacterium]